MACKFSIQIRFIRKDKTAGEISLAEEDYFDDSESAEIEIDSPVRFPHAWEYLPVPFLELGSTVLTVTSKANEKKIIFKESFWGSQNQFSLIMRRDYDGNVETYYSATLVISELDKPKNFHYLDITRNQDEGWSLKGHMAIKSSGETDEEVFYFLPTEEERQKGTTDCLSLNKG